MQKYLWFGNRKYYYNDTFNTWEEAYKRAQSYKKKNRKCKYFITKERKGIIAYDVYHLYVTKVIRLTW